MLCCLITFAFSLDLTKREVLEYKVVTKLHKEDLISVNAKGLTIGEEYEIKVSRSSATPVALTFKDLNTEIVEMSDEKIRFRASQSSHMLNLVIIGIGVPKKSASEYEVMLYVSLDSCIYGLPESVFLLVRSLLCALPVIVVLSQLISSFLPDVTK